MSVIPSSSQVDALLQLELELRAAFFKSRAPSKVINGMLVYLDHYTRAIHLAKAIVDAPQLAHNHKVRSDILRALSLCHNVLLRAQIKTNSSTSRLMARLSNVAGLRRWASQRWKSPVKNILFDKQAIIDLGYLVELLYYAPKNFAYVEGHSDDVLQRYLSFFENYTGRIIFSPEVFMEDPPTGDPNPANLSSEDDEETSPPIASDEQVLVAVNSLRPRYLPFAERLMLGGSASVMHPYGPEVLLAIQERSRQCQAMDQRDVSPSGWVPGAHIHVDVFYDTQPLEVQLVSADHVATGASGTIYKGRTRFGLVALKVFHGVLDYKNRKLLTRELSNTKDLRHGNILPFIGTAVYEQRTIIVSPFMRNGDMLHYLLCYRHTKRLELIIQVAQAVQYLHSEVRLAHGDLKCENVLISDQGTALLADFGLSTFIDNRDVNLSTSSDYQIQNTLAFAAPELLFGDVEQTPPSEPAPPQPKTRESDVYAFGMLILQAFTAKAPWHGYNAGQILGLVFTGTLHPRPARNSLMEELSDYLWEHCRACWTRKPADRPTIVEVQQKLWSEQSTRSGRLTHDGVEQSLVLRDYRDVMPVP